MHHFAATALALRLKICLNHGAGGAPLATKGHPFWFSFVGEESHVAQQLPKKVEEPTAPLPARRRLDRVTRVQPPDRRTVVVHNFQWHLIIRALAILTLALAVVL